MVDLQLMNAMFLADSAAPVVAYRHTDDKLFIIGRELSLWRFTYLRANPYLGHFLTIRRCQEYVPCYKHIPPKASTISCTILGGPSRNFRLLVMTCAVGKQGVQRLDLALLPFPVRDGNRVRGVGYSYGNLAVQGSSDYD